MTSDVTGRSCGFGTAVVTGNASPDWRVYAGLNYTFGPLWKHQVGLEESVVAPLVRVPQAVPHVERFRATNLLFAFDSDQMTDDHEEVLANLIAYLRKTPFQKMVIEGHTDSVGRHEYNMELSRRRANTVRTFFINEKGFDAKKIDIEG